MSHRIAPSYSLPDWGHFCPGCGRVACRCLPEHEYSGRYGRSYRAGYVDGVHDGLDQRPLTESIYTSGSRVVYEGRRVVHVMTAIRFAEFTWRRSFASEAHYALWFTRTYGHDLTPYLDGFDDACCGLPSAIDDPDGHAEASRMLDGYAHPAFDPVGT